MSEVTSQDLSGRARNILSGGLRRARLSLTLLCSPRLVAVLVLEALLRDGGRRRLGRAGLDVGEVDDDVGDGGGRHGRRLQEEVDVQEHGDCREAQQGAHQGSVQLKGIWQE